MRLYQSSYRLGNKPEELLKLLHGRTKTAIIANAVDFRTPEEKETRIQKDLDDLKDLD